jgi:hypothetical protein
MEFNELKELKNLLTSIRKFHVPTMNYYASSDGRGFWHQISRKDIASLSSTATSVSSLIRAGEWTNKERNWGKSERVATRLLKKPWVSADLKPNNSFSLAFIAQGVMELAEAEPFPRAASFLKVVKTKIIPRLRKAILTVDSHLGAPGSVSIDPYPPSAYLTQLAYRVVTRASKGTPSYKVLRARVREWARSEVYRQLALIDSKSRIADPPQLAYAIILLATSVVEEFTSPEEKILIRKALKTFFDAQQEDGTWPPSQPLFHYPKFGNAHCFDYEVLSELLWCEQLRDELLPYLPKLQKSAEHLEPAAFHISAGTRGWASGHHPQIEGPESWSTACVFDFVCALDRFVAEAIRRSLFDELGAVYTPPIPGASLKKTRRFAPNFLDADVIRAGRPVSLKSTLLKYFVAPIDKEKEKITIGSRLSKTTPMSAILYGPPGTSKTQLAKLVGEYLGWPTVIVDPSYVVQDGLDHLYARAGRLFSILTEVERVVVLLDEFDELGRDRAHETEVLSRFITTAMLPKLAAINDERKIVFLLATNYLTRFDAAFRRGGRFDMVIQVMPPTFKAKQQHPDWQPILAAALASLPVGERQLAREGIADLTFLEMEQLIIRLRKPSANTTDELNKAFSGATLNRLNIAQKTWKSTSSDEANELRLPAI